MPNSPDAVRSRLEADRKDLLDLSLRNPLLNFRPRARSLELIGEAPAEVFRILVRDGKSMSFLRDPAAEASAVEGAVIDQAETSPIQVMPPGSLTDLKLQTSLSQASMDSRLQAIYYAARTSIEEQGVNTLYLALGMLNWYDEETSTKRLRAPLILVPVGIERSSTRERFRVRHDGDDLGFNLSLAEKLKGAFGLELPPLPDSEELDVAHYFDAVAQAVQGRMRWEVERDAVALSFFSFGKFLMYLDLDEASWPPESRPACHPILQALLGDGFLEAPPTISEEEPLDPHLDPREARQVLDADSSQLLALIDANQGRNLVIQGPPGTGKSQTITNLIAEAVGRGRKVLFVAEKMAALEVVKRRLDGAGLGDACLELHSHKTNKKAVVAELRRTLESSRPRLGTIDDDLRLLTSVRDRLNAYCEAVNSPIEPTSSTPHQAVGMLLRLRTEGSETTPPRLAIPAMSGWSDYDFKRRNDLVEQFQARLGAVGVPREHPFWGSRRKIVLPSDRDLLRSRIDEARHAIEALEPPARQLAERLGMEPPADPSACEVLVRCARQAEAWTRWPSAAIQNEEWQSREADRKDLLEAGARLAEIHRRLEGVVIADAWDTDLLETRQDLNHHGRRWFPFLSGAYRKARGHLARLCVGKPPSDLDACLALIDAVMEARRHRETIRRLDPLAARLFGASWQGERSDWSALEETSQGAAALLEEVQAGRIPEAFVGFLAGRPNLAGLPERRSAVEGTLADAKQAVSRLLETLEFDDRARFGDGGIETVSYQALLDLLGLWTSRTEALQSLAALNVVAEVCRDEGLHSVLTLAETWQDASLRLAWAFRHAWYESLLERAYRERPALTGFERRDQERGVARFRELDRLALRHAQARLAHDHWRALPRHEGGGQLAVLHREFEKRARHLPVRQLIARSGNAVQAIKPVFMMSPLSVASYLPPGSIEFDLVVFDEASQVRPVDALGALLRGRQAIVVGDQRQLPPTSFFDRLIGGDDLDDDAEASRDVESVLGLFVAQRAPQRMLRWHYRSRHESLIAVSNHEFYEDRLIVFPSPDAARRESGLVFHHLPKTTYDRGRTRTNPGEAEEVAHRVMDFAREQLQRPESVRLTLGVAAFSMAQMAAIVDQLERLRREDPTCEEFFAVGNTEPFFIKNLENVQGDERDVIFISVGYGRTAEGLLAMSFGPLNGDGGERRLNVLITRARRRCEVFTNLTADDIDLNRTHARGVVALKTFLAYAQTGKLESAGRPEEETSPPFEEAVRTALAGAGRQVQAQVGSGGFRLDLAVLDPDQPGRYLLGIECDGATYDSARSARDRDRLRRQVLESLGWQIHQVWSIDWYRDPEGAAAQVLVALEKAQAVPLAEEPTRSSDSASSEATLPELDNSVNEPDAAEPGSLAVEVPPYQITPLTIETGGKELHEIPPRRLAGWIGQVVHVEGPIQASEAGRRIVEAAGGKRMGSRIQASFDRAVALAARQGLLRREGDFLWPVDMTRPAVRDRSGLPTPARKLDLVASEEIAAAIERVVVDAFGMEPAAIPNAACRLLGFNRVSDEMRRRLDEIVAQLVQQKRLVPRGDHLVIPDLKVAG